MSTATANLMLHCGARFASLDDVYEVETPENTRTWAPMPHGEFIDTVKLELEARGYTIDKEEYGLQDGKYYIDGDRYDVPDAKLFGVMTLKSDAYKNGYDLALGLRNSHDKSIANSVFLGSRVFVCDNMAYSGLVQLIKKHCTNTMIEYNASLADAFDQLAPSIELQERRFEAYKDTELTQEGFHDILCRAIKGGVLGSRKFLTVLNEWEQPRHKEFRDKTVFSAFNAFTEVAKETDVFKLPERMMTLHNICDDRVFAN